MIAASSFPHLHRRNARNYAMICANKSLHLHQELLWLVQMLSLICLRDHVMIGTSTCLHLNEGLLVLGIEPLLQSHHFWLYKQAVWCTSWPIWEMPSYAVLQHLEQIKRLLVGLLLTFIINIVAVLITQRKEGSNSSEGGKSHCPASSNKHRSSRNNMAEEELKSMARVLIMGNGSNREDKSYGEL